MDKAQVSSNSDPETDPKAGAFSVGKQKGQIPGGYNAETDPKAASSSTMIIQPRISVNSRVRKKVKDTPQPDNKCRRRGRNDGKLKQLMDMPLEVFFQITSNLKPLDILQLSRVSKHFRHTFTSRSSKLLWKSARANVSDMPDPPSVLSEMKYAVLVFEHNCIACGVGRSPKVDHALSVRFCGACWKVNVAKGKALLKYTRAESIMLTLLPHEHHQYGGIDPKQNSEWNSYYVPEFEAVLEHFCSLSQHDRQAYIEERQNYVLQMHEHAKAVSAWELRVRGEQAREDSEAQKKRQESIEEKLFAMGYTKDDFPSTWHPDWAPYVNQPRVLTPRIWKHIEPKLIEAINAQRQRRAIKERELRVALRRDELRALYNTYLANLPDDFGPVPTYPDLDKSEQITTLLQEGDAELELTQERFDAVVPEVVSIYGAETIARILKSLRGQDKEPAVGFIDAEHPNMDNSEGEENTAVRPKHNEPSAEEVLSRATCLFKCGHCSEPYLDKRLRSFWELVRHVRKAHISSSGNWHFPRTIYILAKDAVGDAVKILKKLDLPEDTKYSDVTRRIVCMCGHPKLNQPVTFAELVHHIRMERQMWTRLVANRAVNKDVDEVLHNNHDLDSPEPWIKFIHDGEDFPTFEWSPVQLDFKHRDSVSCEVCDTLLHKGYEWHPGLRSSYNHEDFVHHVRSKHLREPRQDDIKF